MEMKVEFIDGKMKVTHPTGETTEYSRENLENVLASLITDKESLEKSIRDVEENISKLSSM